MPPLSENSVAHILQYHHRHNFCSNNMFCSISLVLFYLGAVPSLVYSFRPTTDDGIVDLAVLVNILLTMTALVSVLNVRESREPSVLDQRRSWNEYVEKHKNDRMFHRNLRMSLESFNKLLGLIRGDLEINTTMAALCGGAIIPEVCLFCTLRWLAGGSYIDVHDLMGVSRASFFRVVWKTIKARCCCPELRIGFPVTEGECAIKASGFEGISYRGVVANRLCLCPLHQPLLLHPLKFLHHQWEGLSG